MWMIVVILQCILAKIIPGISILVMNVIIIVKVIFSSKCLYTFYLNQGFNFS